MIFVDIDKIASRLDVLDIISTFKAEYLKSLENASKLSYIEKHKTTFYYTSTYLFKSLQVILIAFMLIQKNIDLKSILKIDLDINKLYNNIFKMYDSYVKDSFNKELIEKAEKIK